MIDAADVAHELVAAEREHKAIGQFSDAHPDFDLATAYQAQRLFVAANSRATSRSPVCRVWRRTGFRPR